MRLTNENARLANELTRARAVNEDLTRSAWIWIRLYEAQLARARQPQTRASNPSMEASPVRDEPHVTLRRTRAARVVQHACGMSVFPEPHAAPVLPAGWPPLSSEDEASVLRACDVFVDACRLRLGSVWDADIEYRVYCLDAEEWRGVCAATLFTTDTPDADGPAMAGRNTRLLAIGQCPEDAVRVAMDFLNWDLEAHGNDWRLAVKTGR